MMDDLIDRYGSHNVEQAQIFISQQCDRNGVETTNYYWADHG
jgi:hypothetical protein